MTKEKEVLELLTLKDLYHENESFRLCKKTRFFLIKLGISVNLIGYDYLVDSIVLTIYDPENIAHITKNIYPDIAKKHKDKSTHVERSIRTAITKYWKNCRNYSLAEKVFDCTPNETRCPTNSEFIRKIVEFYFLTDFQY